MPRLSKAVSRDQARIADLIAGRGRLSVEDRDFIYDHYHPGAVCNTASCGAFFTPRAVADEMYVWCQCEGETVLDIAAGIGILGYGVLARRPKLLVCLEVKSDFVAIGKRVLPEAEWVCGDVFDPAVRRRLLKRFGRFAWGMSNPPYGVKVRTDHGLKYGGRSELMAIEAAVELAPDSIFIMPAGSLPWSYSFKQQYVLHDPPPKPVAAFMKANPKVQFHCLSVDSVVFKDDWVDGTAMVELIQINEEAL